MSTLSWTTLYRSIRGQIKTVSTTQRIKLLEEPLEKDYGNDLLSLIAGYDVDADKRQRNREIACSGKYKPTEGEIQMLLKYPRLRDNKRRRFRDGS
jgi:hypothetical protein